MATKTVKGKVTCNLLNFRSEPVIEKNNVIAQIKKDEIVRIFDESDENFYKVRYTNSDKKVITGYVMKTFIQKLEEPKKEAEDESE